MKGLRRTVHTSGVSAHPLFVILIVNDEEANQKAASNE